MTQTKAAPSKPGLFSSLLGGDKARLEKARLEAFLAAVPGEYCGWAPDGSLAYSEGFCRALGLDAITRLQDIQNTLFPSDAMALEGLFTELQESAKTFCVPVRNTNRSKTFKLCGTVGHDTTGTMTFHILWLEDVTEIASETKAREDSLNAAKTELDRMQAAMDQLPVPIWMRNGQGDIFWCNRAYALALDTTTASIIKDQKEFPQSIKSPTARKPGGTQQKPAGKALALAALESGKAETTRAHVILAGTRRLLQITEQPMSALSLSIGIANDITRVEELETEQRRNTAANKELLEHLGSAIAIFDADQRIEFFNSAFAQLWQLEDTWLNAKPKLGDIMEKLRETRKLPEQADFKHFRQSWTAMFTSLITAHEDMLYLPDGRALRRLAIPHPMGGLMMIFEDVTGRLELESSYNTLIAVQRETLDNLTEGVAVFGSDGRLKLWNPSFVRLWDLNPEDVDGYPHVTLIVEKIRDFFPADDWVQQKEGLIALAIGRQEREGRLNRTDQSLIDYATMPLPDGGVLLTFVDVTGSVRMETALRERNAALEAAERVKLDFLANVSYQLRTPLNAIMGFAEILHKQFFGPLNEKQIEYTTGLQDASGRLVSLIDDILDLSTIEAGYMEMDRQPLDAAKMLQDLDGLVRDWAGTRQIILKTETGANLPAVMADERRIKQAMINLIRNAISFTPAGGTIMLRGDVAGPDRLVLSVTDTGPGIDLSDQERIFEPFERAGNTASGVASDGRGAGLGLTLVRNIVQLHDGNIEMTSTPGKGTEVRILLPVA